MTTVQDQDQLMTMPYRQVEKLAGKTVLEDNPDFLKSKIRNYTSIMKFLKEEGGNKYIEELSLKNGSNLYDRLFKCGRVNTKKLPATFNECNIPTRFKVLQICKNLDAYLKRNGMENQTHQVLSYDQGATFALWGAGATSLGALQLKNYYGDRMEQISFKYIIDTNTIRSIACTNAREQTTGLVGELIYRASELGLQNGIRIPLGQTPCPVIGAFGYYKLALSPEKHYMQYMVPYSTLNGAGIAKYIFLQYPLQNIRRKFVNLCYANACEGCGIQLEIDEEVQLNKAGGDTQN